MGENMNNYILKLYLGAIVVSEQRSFSLRKLKRLCSAIQDKNLTHAEINLELGEHEFYRYHCSWINKMWRKIKC